MADLKTTYQDDVLDTSVNEKRKYNMIQNADGTVSFEDVTTYSQVGNSFGAADINATNEKVNEVNSNLNGFSFRTNEGNKEVSTDGGKTWENFSSGAELLWENSAPSSPFDAKTISIDLSKYSHIIVVHNGWNAGPEIKNIFQKGVSDNLYYVAGANRYTRAVTISDNSIAFQQGYYNGTASGYACKPISIYGFNM